MPQVISCGCESARLNFIAERDGFDAAIAFAQATLPAYRKAVLCSTKRGERKPHHASAPTFRRGFIQSYLSFKTFLKQNAR